MSRQRKLLFFPCQSSFFTLLQFAAQDFTGGNFGDGVDELDDVNRSVAGQFAVDKGKDIVRSKIVALANDDEAFGQFSSFVIGHANDRGVHDGRMLQEQRLQLGGGNAKALVLDHLFLSVDDIGEA